MRSCEPPMHTLSYSIPFSRRALASSAPHDAPTREGERPLSTVASAASPHRAPSLKSGFRGSRCFRGGFRDKPSLKPSLKPGFSDCFRDGFRDGFRDKIIDALGLGIFEYEYA